MFELSGFRQHMQPMMDWYSSNGLSNNSSSRNSDSHSSSRSSNTNSNSSSSSKNSSTSSSSSGGSRSSGGSSKGYDPTSAITAAQKAWQQANARGDQAGMDAAHQAAETARARAGWGSGGSDGSATSGRMSGGSSAGVSGSGFSNTGNPYQEVMNQLAGLQNQWNTATSDEARNSIHDQANQLRSRSGISNMFDPNTGAVKSEYSKTLGGGNGFSTPTNTVISTPKGYAYTDKYGYSHVVGDLNTAQEYARDATGPTSPWSDAVGNKYQIYTDPGQVYGYNGAYTGGYALDNTGQRMPIPIAGSQPYGNDLRDKTGYSEVPTLEDFSNKYAQALSGPVNQQYKMSENIPHQQMVSVANTQPMTQQNLSMYTNNPNQGYDAIKNLQDAWNRATSQQEKDAIHNQANSIRDAMGIAGAYNMDTGASLIPQTWKQNEVQIQGQLPVSYQQEVQDQMPDYNKYYQMMLQNANVPKMEDVQRLLDQRESDARNSIDSVYNSSLGDLDRQKYLDSEAQRRQLAANGLGDSGLMAEGMNRVSQQYEPQYTKLGANRLTAMSDLKSKGVDALMNFQQSIAPVYANLATSAMNATQQAQTLAQANRQFQQKFGWDTSMMNPANKYQLAQAEWLPKTAQSQIDSASADNQWKQMQTQYYPDVTQNDMNYKNQMAQAAMISAMKPNASSYQNPWNTPQGAKFLQDQQYQQTYDNAMKSVDWGGAVNFADNPQDLQTQLANWLMQKGIPAGDPTVNALNSIFMMNGYDPTKMGQGGDNWSNLKLKYSTPNPYADAINQFAGAPQQFKVDPYQYNEW